MYRVGVDPPPPQNKATVSPNSSPLPPQNIPPHHPVCPQGYFDRGHCCFMLWRMMEASVLLAITGIITALITLAVNISVYYFTPLRFLLVSSLDADPATPHGPGSHALAATAFTCYIVVMSLIAVVITNNICPEAVGGGIPDVKTVLSGLVSQSVLSVRLIWAKMLGLLFALVAGLSVGKEVSPSPSPREGLGVRSFRS
jgi:H+/Cl- antiporter ClcA